MTSPSKSWHEHPVYVAAVAVAGTIGLSILLYKEVLLPAQMAARDFQIEELRRINDSLSNQKFDLEQKIRDFEVTQNSIRKNLEEALTQVRGDLTKKTTELNEYKKGSLFLNGSPYPVGLDEIKIGQSIHTISQKYPDEKTKKQDGYWSVDIDHPYFKDITFYFWEEADYPIYQISYSAGYLTDVGPEFLQTQIERTLGMPLKIADDHFIWHTRQNLAVYKGDDHYFILGEQGQPPGGWERHIIRFVEKSNLEANESTQKP